ncbi:serine hydrolase [Ramlibacter ginsenosidimutans]|uniref:Serine hydrolase n=1 Tax=Ramlibacter ginsenosidimutans TaxID=502333 RepID=A0A934TX81_9BURK|nr:serine hydrolase [Ramlibacter ginsenosidimutans]MBK6008951.1 serine hydrolase [Ramlibacter ginsenosidimutans]
MTRAVSTRGPHWALSLLLPLCMLLGLDAAQATQPHTRHVTAKRTTTHPASHPAKVARKSSVRGKTVSRRQAAHRGEALARAHRPAHVHRAVAHVDPDAPPRITANVAYVVDQQTGEVLLGRNEEVVHPIASLTKLMTGMIVAEAQLPMDEKIVIDDSDVDRLKFSSSRLRVGTELTRGEALHLALMSSENRAAHALARTYPGGESAFVSAMNVKARQLGMEHTTYVEPTGLSSENQSSAHDLALLTAAAYEHPLLRRYTTSPGYRLATDHGTTQYVNTNRLVRAGTWDIGLQKTGYIREAGDCLILQAKLAGRKLIMVFLDSASALARFTDAEHVRTWLRAHPDLTAEDKGAAAPS